MKPYELLRSLVADRGGALAVAKAMGSPSFQGTLHKVCAGNVSSPKRSTAEKIAKFFSIPIEAIYDESVATQVAANLAGMGKPPKGPPAYSWHALHIAEIYDSLPDARSKRILWATAESLDVRDQEGEDVGAETDAPASAEPSSPPTVAPKPVA